MHAGRAEAEVWSEKLLWAGLAAALVLPVLLTWPFLHHPPAVFSLKRLGLLLGVALAGGGALGRLRAGFLPSAFGLLAWGVLAATVLSAASSPWPGDAWREALRWGLLLAALGAATVVPRSRRARRLRLLLDLATLAAAVAALVHLFQLAGLAVSGSDPLGWTSRVTTDLPSGTYPNRNQLATVMAALLPWALLRAARARHSEKTAPVAAWSGVALLLLVDLLATRSEGAWAAALVSGLLVLAMKPDTRGAASERRRGRTGLVLACGLSLCVSGVLLLAVLGGRAARALPDAAPVVERVALWNLALQSAAERPWRGWGPGSYGHLVQREQGNYAADPAWEGVEFLSRHAHDDPLEAAASTGLPGAALLLALLGVPLVRLWRRPALPEEIALAAGLLAVLVHGLVHYPLHVPGPDAFAFVAAGLLAAGDRPKEPTGGRRRPAGMAAAMWIVGMVAVTAISLQDLRADVLFDRALEAGEAGRLSRSEAAFRGTIALRDDRSAVWNGLGAVLLMQGRPLEARNALGRARRLAPEDPDVLANLATAEVMMGAEGEAARLFESALVRNPRHLASLLGRARLALRAGRPDLARELLSRAREVDPSDEEVQELLGRVEDEP